MFFVYIFMFYKTVSESQVKSVKKRDRLILGKQLAQFGLAVRKAKGLEKKD